MAKGLIEKWGLNLHSLIFLDCLRFFGCNELKSFGSTCSPTQRFHAVANLQVFTMRLPAKSEPWLRPWICLFLALCNDMGVEYSGLYICVYTVYIYILYMISVYICKAALFDTLYLLLGIWAMHS